MEDQNLGKALELLTEVLDLGYTLERNFAGKGRRYYCVYCGVTGFFPSSIAHRTNCLARRIKEFCNAQR